MKARRLENRFFQFYVGELNWLYFSLRRSTFDQFFFIPRCRVVTTHSMGRRKSVRNLSVKFHVRFPPLMQLPLQNICPISLLFFPVILLSLPLIFMLPYLQIVISCALHSKLTRRIVQAPHPDPIQLTKVFSSKEMLPFLWNTKANIRLTLEHLECRHERNNG